MTGISDSETAGRKLDSHAPNSKSDEALLISERLGVCRRIGEAVVVDYPLLQSCA